MKYGKKPKRLIVRQKTGFRNLVGTHVVILDEEYKPFYDTRIVNNRVREFNLPPGIYYLQEGKITPRVAPLEYTLEPLPPFRRKLRHDPETFPIIYGNNEKHTASVFWDAERSPFGKRCIFLDASLREMSKPRRMFIIYHECAHRYYDCSSAEEAACDAYARNKMLEEGYNPSQIGEAMITTLSSNNDYRKDLMVNSLKGM